MPDITEGMRARDPNGPIYLMLDGVLRHIPDIETYNNLFTDAGGGPITFGPPLTRGAYLARMPGDPAFYLVVDGKKRHITSQQAMAQFGFNDAKVQQKDISGIPVGAPIASRPQQGAPATQTPPTQSPPTVPPTTSGSAGGASE